MTLSCEILHLTFPSLTKCKTLDLTHHYCIMLVQPGNQMNQRKQGSNFQMAQVKSLQRLLKPTCVLNFATDDSTKVSKEKNY